MTTTIERTIDAQPGARTTTGDDTPASPKVTVAASDLRRAVTAIARIVPGKTAMAVIADLRLTAEDDHVALTATDLMTAATVTIPATVRRPGAAMLDAPRLAGLVARITGDVEIDHRPSPGDRTGTGQVTLTAGPVRTNLNSLAARDYPALPSLTDEPDGTQRLVVSARSLRLALEQVIVAVARDDSRPVLSGIHLRADRNGLIRLVSCDGFRLVRTELDTRSGAGADLSIIVVGSALRHLIRLLPADETDVTLTSIPGGHVTAQWADTVWFGRTIVGDYPDAEAIIPRVSAIEVAVDHEQVLDALTIALPFAAGNADVVRLAFTADRLSVCATSPEAGDVRTDVDAVATVVDTSADGPLKPAGEFALNADYLRAHLGVAAGRVRFGYTSHAGTIVLRSDDRPETTHVLMPMVAS